MMQVILCYDNRDMYTILLFTDPFQDHTSQFRSHICKGECGGVWDLNSIERYLAQYNGEM